MARPLPRRVLAGVTSLLMGGVLVAASAFAALADTPYPVNATVTATTTQASNGPVTVDLSGTLTWKRSVSCGSDRQYGFAITWDDPTSPGYPVGGSKGTQTVRVGTQSDSTVHLTDCSDPTHFPGSAGGASHTYKSAGDVPQQICVIGYDVDPTKTSGGHSQIAGGTGYNDDNSWTKGEANPRICVAPKIAGSPDLSINKTPDKASVTAGSNEPLSYTITVKNVDPTNPATQGITITDNLPANLQYQSLSNVANGWTCSGGQLVSCTTSSTLAGGASVDVVRINGIVTATSAGQLTNVATVSTPNDPNPNNNTVTVNTPVVAPGVDVGIAEIAEPSVAVGANINYRITVTNTRPTATTSPLHVVANLPTGVPYVSHSWGAGWTCTGDGTLTCDYAPSLAAGQSAPQLVLVGHAVSVGSFLGTASVSMAGDSDPTNNNANAPTVVGAPNGPDVTITETAPSQVAVGDPITYEITVTNDSGVATNRTLTLNASLPPGVTYVSHAWGSGWSCTGDGTLVCQYSPVLDPGALTPPVTLRGTATSAAVPSVTATSTVTNPNDTDPTNNHASATTKVVAPSANFTLVKVADPASGSTVSRGQRISYRLHYANTGNAAATADFSDTVPVGTTYVSGSATCGSGCTAGYDAAHNTVHWTLDAAPGTQGDLTFAVTVNSNNPDGAVISNVGTLHSGTTTVTSNKVQHQVYVPTGALQLAKSATLPAGRLTTAQPGDLVTFTLVATATGNITQHDVRVTDAVPAGTTFSAADCGSASSCTSNVANGVVTWRLGDLAAGQSRTVHLSVLVNGPAADGTIPTQIANIGNVVSADTPNTPSNRVVVPLAAVLGETITRGPTTGSLPYTGSNAVAEALAAAVLIGAGLVLLTWPGLRPRRFGAEA